MEQEKTETTFWVITALQQSFVSKRHQVP
jgi:hypothetical protein